MVEKGRNSGGGGSGRETTMPIIEDKQYVICLNPFLSSQVLIGFSLLSSAWLGLGERERENESEKNWH